MLCRKLRIPSWRGIALTLTACVALVVGLAILPTTWSEKERPSLMPTTHTFPLTALAESASLRIEKQARSHRPLIKKLDRSAQVAAAMRAPKPLRVTATSHISATRLRRHLYAPRSQPSSADDPSHSLLS